MTEQFIKDQRVYFNSGHPARLIQTNPDGSYMIAPIYNNDRCKPESHAEDAAEWVEGAPLRVFRLDEPRWIPVSERLPEEYQTVCVKNEHGTRGLIYTTSYSQNFPWWDGIGHYELMFFTHWQPLPALPGKEGEA